MVAAGVGVGFSVAGASAGICVVRGAPVGPVGTEFDDGDSDWKKADGGGVGGVACVCHRR